MRNPLRCLFAATEVVGFAKTGGLADVAAALPAALANGGVDVAIIMPLYRGIRLSRHTLQPTPHVLSVPIRDQNITGKIWQSILPGTKVPVYLIEQVGYFERDGAIPGASLYQYVNDEGQRVDYPDNCERFTFFSRAILEAIRVLNFWPDVIHVNDWQTSLVPLYLKELYRTGYSAGDRDRYRRIRTMLTIHNLAYQGLFWQLDMPILGLSPRLFNSEHLEFYGKINFLKAGLVFSDLLTAVSPTYAKEIQTRYFGCGLDGVLRRRTRELFGIVNGVDYSTWDPAVDSHLPIAYDGDTVAQGKAECKAALQEAYKLPEKPKVPLFGMVTRLATQKGLDILRQGAERWIEEDLQVVFLGEGEAIYQNWLLEFQKKHPTKVGVKLGHNEPLAHLLEAGSDVFLMPSQYEPCGLSQMYSLKYGTLPLVRATGGLADTVVDASPSNLSLGTATGFSFIPYTGPALVETMQRAMKLYRDKPEVWRQVQKTGMAQDWSWSRSAAEYERLYRQLQSSFAPL